MDDDGDFLVTWQSADQDGSNDGVYAQRYNAAGVPQGSEFRVNTFTTGSQTRPAVAMDDDGDVVVTWHSRGQDGSDFGVYAQRYNAAGVPQGSEFRVNTFTTGRQSTPAVAMDDDGDFVVTWHSLGQDGSSYGVYAQRYNAAGVAQESEFRVNTFTTDNQIFPTVAMDDDGNVVVTWGSVGQDGSGYGVYAQRYRICDGDCDGDGIPPLDDNCPFANNPDQTDSDIDALGYACDDTPLGSCLGAAVTLRGTAGNDTLTGTLANDVIDGVGGNDVVNGGGGNDRLCGSDGEDELSGGAGDDRLSGGRGLDSLNGGAGNDLLFGGDDGDTLNGSAGNDMLLGQGGADALDGGVNNDQCSGGTGIDIDTAVNCETTTTVP